MAQDYTGDSGLKKRILLTLKTDENVRDGVPSLVLTVDDVFRHYQELTQKGVVFKAEPTTAPWDDGEVYAIFRDSEDNLVMLGTEGL